jgi:hypothetical protein
MPINYKLGKIYKIECNVTGLIYVGSTCEPILARRLSNHVGYYQCYLNGTKKYLCSSYKILENGNYDITLLEKYPCESKDELHTRERYWTNQIECVNKNKAGIFNELGKQEYLKQYYVNNKEKLQEKLNCECGGCYTYEHKTQHLKTKKHKNFIKTDR